MSVILFLISSVSHRVIGIWYFLFSVLAGFFGFVFSVCVRFEVSLVSFSVCFGDFQLYSVFVTCHGLVMIFGFVMPVVLGSFGNYFIPVFVSVCDMALPRFNCVSLWLYFLGFSLVFVSSVVDEGIGFG